MAKLVTVSCASCGRDAKTKKPNFVAYCFHCIGTSKHLYHHGLVVDCDICGFEFDRDEGVSSDYRKADICENCF